MRAEITRGGWLAGGTAFLATAAVAHAVADAAHIAGGVVHTRPTRRRVPAQAVPALPLESGRGGWLLVTAGLLAAGAVMHAVDYAKEMVRELTEAPVPVGPPGVRAARRLTSEGGATVAR
ncbi:hypothetical protein [Yinghuangia seranimata]|uniref:hypothetical protein n=1 Tax=Yinghuangia seranimata TaxID=408067 RepID=UPI00248C7929|nr:hypothetical protein [Yinghuangia seranimata]MDI2129089.1 hypothetical protein [Yinghuangia seranimata]